MTTARRKTDLSPLEAIVVEHTLGATNANGQSPALARIQLLTRERAQLYSHSAAHPFSAPRNAQRIRAINAEIEALWVELRRERAQRRVQIERALNITAEEDEKESLEDIFADEPKVTTPRANAKRRPAKSAQVTQPAAANTAPLTAQSAKEDTVRKTPARKATTPRKRVATTVAVAIAETSAQVAGVA